MWNIKKILLILIFLFWINSMDYSYSAYTDRDWNVWNTQADANESNRNINEDLMDQIIPDNDTITIKWVDSNWGDWLWVIWGIVVYIKNSIFWLLSVIAIGMFIYTGFRLVKAEWNPEEMSKVWKTLIHVVVWLFIVAASWAIVAMVSGTKF